MTKSAPFSRVVPIAAAAGGLVVGLVLGWLHGVSGAGAANWPAWIEAGSAVATALMTAAIFAVGRTQLGIYRQQAAIMDEQRRIARGEAYIAPVCEHNFARALHATPEQQHRGDDTYVFSAVPEVRVHLRNYSTVPAVLREVRLRLRLQEMAPAPHLTPHPVDIPGEHVLPPGGVSEAMTAHIGFNHNAISRKEYRHLAAGEVFFWFYGTVQFDDLWGERSLLHFCWQYDHAFGVFRPWPREGNFIERLAAGVG